MGCSGFSFLSSYNKTQTFPSCYGKACASHTLPPLQAHVGFLRRRKLAHPHLGRRTLPHLKQTQCRTRQTQPPGKLSTRNPPSRSTTNYGKATSSRSLCASGKRPASSFPPTLSTDCRAGVLAITPPSAGAASFHISPM